MENVEKYLFFNKKQFVEPFSGALHDRTFGAMPANPFLNDEVVARQLEVDTQLIKLFKYPPKKLEIPTEFREFFLEDHFIGEARRKMLNFNSYALWQQKLQGLAIPEYLSEQKHLFETGRAEPDEILDIIVDPINDKKETAIKSFELGKITGPYWQRMQDIPKFRQSVTGSIESHGGTVFPTILPYRSIKIMPKTVVEESGLERIVGFIVMYKHDIGEIIKADGARKISIVERQIAGYRVDEASGFRQDILENMHLLARTEDQTFSWENIRDERFEINLRNSGCRGFIEKAIQLDSTEAFVVPHSTTIYGFNVFNDTTTQPAESAYRKPDSDDIIAVYGSTS